MYVGTARTPMPGVGYATISLVRNLSHNGFVLIIAGTNMEGTEAAGELVTDWPAWPVPYGAGGSIQPRKWNSSSFSCGWIT